MFKDPFIISSIILACSFFFILLCNHVLKNKLIKLLFIILSSIYLVLIFVFDNQFVYQLFKTFITYFWYPNYLIFVTLIIISVIIFLVSLFKKKLSMVDKTLNDYLFCLNFSCYIIFLRLGIDTSLYSSLYSTESLTIMRIVTVTFTIWLIIKICLKYFIRGWKWKVDFYIWNF